MKKTTIFGAYEKEREGINIILNGVNNHNKVQAQSVFTLDYLYLPKSKLHLFRLDL
jgi:hypothetical protein